MKLAIMQPYFLPYLGYFQLLHAVDQFVIYDNIEFSKRGWVQRNRILVNGAPAFISLPLKKDSDYLDICQRRLADTFHAERAKLLGKIDQSYRRAPFHAITMELVRECFACRDSNLFDFVHGSVRAICRHLDMTTPITISSTLGEDRSHKGQDRVLAICKAVGCDGYINAINGRVLYESDAFSACGIDLQFLQMRPIHYPQFDSPFVPNLSIIDVLMFNSVERVRELLNEYDLVRGEARRDRNPDHENIPNRQVGGRWQGSRAAA